MMTGDGVAKVTDFGLAKARALAGEDIGIVYSATGQIVALRPVEVYSEDYALREYGLRHEEMNRAEKNIIAGTKKERKQGKLKSGKTGKKVSKTSKATTNSSSFGNLGGVMQASLPPL